MVYTQNGATQPVPESGSYIIFQPMDEELVEAKEYAQITNNAVLNQPNSYKTGLWVLRNIGWTPEVTFLSSLYPSEGRPSNRWKKIRREHTAEAAGKEGNETDTNESIIEREPTMLQVQMESFVIQNEDLVIGLNTMKVGN